MTCYVWAKDQVSPGARLDTTSPTTLIFDFIKCRVVVRQSDRVPCMASAHCIILKPLSIDPSPCSTHGTVPKVVPSHPRVKTLGTCSAQHKGTLTACLHLALVNFLISHSLFGYKGAQPPLDNSQVVLLFCASLIMFLRPLLRFCIGIR